MNYMNKQVSLHHLRALADRVGDFIRYWGFRRIHGQIWTVLYVFNRDLSGIEIVELLNVSKALVSPALKELEEEGLILQVESENAKLKRYRAQDDVSAIIQGVLRRREKPMLEQVERAYGQLKAIAQEDLSLRKDRLEHLGQMISFAQTGLTFLMEFDVFKKESLK